METFGIKALQLIFSLSILVLVHEFGHFIFSKLFKTRVEKFYLFFDPWFSLFKFKPKNSETEYGIGWLPLGGYCKISGMIDESLDKEQLAKPPQPYEFRSKPAWQRLLIMTAGVIFNFLLALVIYSMVLFHWGDSYVPLDKATYGMEYSETFHNIGFKDGDILLKADDVPLERFNEAVIRKLVEAKTVTVSRNGVDTVINMPGDMMERLLKDKKGFAGFRLPVEVEKVTAESARQAGLQPNDRIICIDGTPTPVYEDMATALYVSKGKTVPFEVERNSQIIELNIPVDTLGKIGIIRKVNPGQIYEAAKVQVKYGFWESFPAGIKSGISTLKGYVSDMKYVFTKEGAKSVGGFGAIGNMFPAVWNWQLFWERTAFLSIILAFMNILPIPALDGGHVLFLLVEVVTGRKPSDKFLERAQIVGMMILFAILIYANGNDLLRFFMK
ncbi:MAG: RIP metalloprotease RseP [Tannerella sp.]|jgi:regulator of sigma E protease|nr:RIP metalloprotease RseP [Tannerella sp.]